MNQCARRCCSLCSGVLKDVSSIESPLVYYVTASIEQPQFRASPVRLPPGGGN